MKTYRHIVVGTDFSPASRAGLRTALRLAAFDATPVTVVHVIDEQLASAIKEAHQFTDEEVFKHINDRVQSFLQEAETEVSLVNVHLEIGHPFHVLTTTCRKLEADLLVLGTRGTEHGPNHIGAVAAKCARKTPVDVLLVREELNGPFEHITVCVDFSETSAKAVQAARFVAEHDKAALDALFVHQSTLSMSLDYGGFLPPLPEIEVATQENLKKELDGFLSPLLGSSRGLQYQGLVLDRVNIREGIIDHIKESHSDLVVLGTRGKTDLRTLLIGTTAEKIVSHAPCSVLAVKPDALVREAVEEAKAAEAAANDPEAVSPYAPFA